MAKNVVPIFSLVGWLVSTPLQPRQWVCSPQTATGRPPPRSSQRCSSWATAAGSRQRSSGTRVVGTARHANKCFVSCVWCAQSGQCGVGYVVGSILCRYVLRKGDLLVRSCASVLRVWCGSVCSELSIGGGAVSSTLLCAAEMLFWTICECMSLRFCLMVSYVVCCGSV